MAVKLSARQQAMLAALETFPAKFAMIHRLIEEMASPHVDVSVQRRLTRTLDEMKIGAQSVGQVGLADALGALATLGRRTGGIQTRARGLREGFTGLKINFEGAVKAASKPEAVAEVVGDLPAVL
ncbi:MAG: hypothetical protein EXR94_06245 [Gemmatimonadetes bacterium]|nr:hypothetical protein [Gemmatimonadota bacterium]